MLGRKVDCLPEESVGPVLAAAERNPRVLPISALTGERVEALLAAISEDLRATAVEEEIDLPFDDGRRRAWLFERNLVEAETMTDGGHHLTVKWTERDRNRFRQL